ncbi:MAG TPA: urate hydroxylase PuuD [Candidatus Baltobacteraceae bacterium]|nr:urate hydroxylase PuuD [Candidatus Baltobacteraceae bacterium]
MSAYAMQWIDLVVRWFHFVAGISWIGASFYFIWLDDSLDKPAHASDSQRGVLGELWSVHGGGFYHNQKYLTGPTDEPLPEKLHWFKWEAYSTWLSGLAMLAIVYYVNATTFLIDPSVLQLTPAQAILISLGTLVTGWIVYDVLCRLLQSRPLVLGAVIFVLLAAAAFGLEHVFSGRAAYIHIGAIMGTIMAANVFIVIIPGQRKMLAQIRAGKTPDPLPGRLGKIRSVHNTYLTLPVLFTMISFHYPAAYQNGYGWLILVILGVAGVAVRYFFILSHKQRLIFALPLGAAALIAAAAIVALPHPQAAGAQPHVAFAQIEPIVRERCAVCHSTHPTQPGFASAPLGVLLDTPQHIQSNAQRIYAQAVTTHAMPLANATHMTLAERNLVGGWISQGAHL